MSSLHVRFKAYGSDGAFLGFLRPSSWTASVQHDDAGTLSMTYPRIALGGGILKRGLEQGLEIGMEVASHDGAWVEPYNCRFLLVSRSRDAKDGTDTVTLNCMTWIWLTKKILNLNMGALLTDTDNKGKRPFYSANPGLIVRTLLDENRDRGGAATVIPAVFNSSRDANGDTWANKMTLYYDPGVDLYTVIDNLSANGVCDWRTDGRMLKLWNADSTALCRDLSGRIRIPLATGLLESPEEETIEGLAGNILIKGDNDLIFTQENKAAPTPWGKWELYASQGGVSNKDTAELMMQAQLASAARVRGQYTRQILTDGIDHVPLVDYRPGDWITAPTVTHGEKVRVQRVELSNRNDGGVKCALMLNDRLYDAQTRQAKRIQGITGGAVAGGASGAVPAPEKDHRVPKAPTGLVVRTDAYLDANGYARGLATAHWAAVTQATNNTSIEIGSYRVEWRPNTAGETWRSAGVTTGTTLSWGNLDCSTTIQVRVRAVPTYSDKPGEWCQPVTVDVTQDATPPSVPSKPVLASELGVVTIHWDGRNASGGGMEPDFDHLIVGRGTGAGNLAPVSSSIIDVDDFVDTNLGPGSEWTYAFKAVDHAGNESAWSATARITVASAVTPEQVEQIRRDLEDAGKDIGQASKDIQANRAALEQVNRTIAQAQKDIASNAANTLTAQQAAANASNAAKTAQTTADNATSTAKTAQDTALAAKTAAADASRNATQAVDAATAARTAAESAEKTATNAQTAASTASSAAADASRNAAQAIDTAATAKTIADDAGKVATQAKATADTASQAATDAATAARKANESAASAAGIAEGKADVLIQPSEPPAAMRRQTTLWIDTTGNANTPKRWDGTAWRTVTDKAATDAANAAAAAKTAADNAQGTANQATVAAANAAAKAQKAQDTADGALTTADGKSTIYQQADEPANARLKPGDLWWRTQKAWTRWSGAANGSASVLADFTTAWRGEPGNSPSVLTTLSDRIVEVRTWDGDRWNEMDIVASNVLATGTVTAGLIAANSVTADKIAANSVNASKIVAGTITSDKIAANAITSDRIAALAVTTDKIAANSVNASKIVAGTITSDKIKAGQFNGYVFTGAIYQSSTAADTGFKLHNGGLDMWDSDHNHTVHLDGSGNANLLTGTFQTAVSGKRVLIDPDFRTSIVGSPDNTQTGVGVQFVPDGSYAEAPYIGTEFEDSDRGLISTICLNGGMRTDGSAGAGTGFGSFMRLGQYRNGGSESAEFLALTKADYLEKSQDTGRRQWYTRIAANNRSGNGSFTQMYAHRNGNRCANVYAWANDSANSGYTYAGLESVDSNGSVGIQACIDTGLLHFGGFCGGWSNRATFVHANWKIHSGTFSKGMTLNATNCTWTPAKYGRYYAVACADVNFGAISLHVLSTGGAGGCQVMGYNAGAADFNGDCYCDLTAWLVK